MSEAPLPRGVRNHNPGNLRKGIPWIGLAEEQSDPDFCIFTSAEYGIRALCKTLLAYQDWHKLDTIEEIIGRWAPASENDTAAYVDDVCRMTGLLSNEVLNMHAMPTLGAIAEAIIKVECAGYAYPTDVLGTGVRMASAGQV